MKISVIGAGYVGLTVASCLADMGNDVICVDKNSEKINVLKNGIISFFEPGLSEIIKLNSEKNLLNFSTNLTDAVRNSEVCFITVGTPQAPDGSTDLSFVFDATKQIAESMNGYKLIINKSTTPPGTAKKIAEIIRKYSDYPFDVASNPEFLRQGSAIKDFMYPNRIIIGTDNDKVKSILDEIYSPFLKQNIKFVYMDTVSAEMTKYAANCFLATKISYMNELANLCEKTGANIKNVEEGIGTDPRIGNEFLSSGLGYGGSCLPKDIKSLIKTGENLSCKMNILEAVDKVNQNQKHIFLNKIYEKFGHDLSTRTIAIWGLTFKPNTDDLREAPSVTIINDLISSGAKVAAYDPKVKNNAKNLFHQNVIFVENQYDVLINADALLLLTEWDEFKNPDFEKMKTLMKTPVIFDGRNIYDSKDLSEKSFECRQTGM